MLLSRTFALPMHLIWAFMLLACGERYSPWQVTPPAAYRQLTDKQLTKLQETPEQRLPLTLAVLGDPQGTPQDLQSIVTSINARSDVDLVLVLGDLTDHGLLHEYIWAADALTRLDKPFFTVVGNHDAISHGKKIYQKMFGEFNYQFSYAGVKFVMFNNNEFEFGSTDFAWLEQVSDNLTIVGSHVPPVVDMHSQEQIDHWLAINQKSEIITSLHGHRGTKKDGFWIDANIPYYMVPKVAGQRYAIVRIDEQLQASFQYCLQDSCGAERQ